MKISKTLISLSFAAITGLLTSGCAVKKDESTLFTPTDYAILQQYNKSVTAQVDLYAYIDETLGLKKYSYMAFLGDNSPYDQIALECIHSGELKPTQTKEGMIINRSLAFTSCINDASKKPVMIETMLNHHIGWKMTDAKADKELKELILNAKVDNILSVYEFIKIGSLADEKSLKLAIGNANKIPSPTILSANKATVSNNNN